MAQRRMFHTDIVESDRFLDLPSGAQLLYFHLGMQADDDGFINGPKQICRKLRRPTKDLQTLVDAGFLLNFDGIIVIKHFRVANSLKNDRKKPLSYPEIAKQLVIQPNRWYTTEVREEDETLYDIRQASMESEKQQTGIHLDSQPNRTEENRTEENRTEENLTEPKGAEGPGEPADQLRFMGGRLGKGVVLLSEQQIEDLLDKLGLDAFDFYVEKLADYLVNKKIAVKNHYATILKWHEEDKGVRK